MTGTILENLSTRKLSILITILLICQIICFLIGGLISPPPASSQGILATVCLDPNPEDNKNQWFTPECRTVDLPNEAPMKTYNASNLVFAVKMPLYNMDFSRWQQNLVGVLQIDMVYRASQTLKDIIELTLDAKLAYRNKWDPEDKWTYYAGALEKRTMDCSFAHSKTEGYSYNSTTVPLFELCSLHHDYYLLNLRLPENDRSKNMHIGHISDIYLYMIHMNGGFIKVWLSLKTVFFPIIIAIMIWFRRRVRMLSLTPALMEYMLMTLGCTIVFLNIPVEFLTLHFDMPYMLLVNDIRQDIFYAALLSFWIIFAGEHMLIQDDSENNTVKVYWPHLSDMLVQNSGGKNTVKMYWPHFSGIAVGCLSLLIFDLCKHGVQLYNPFFSIWETPIGTNLVFSFITLVGISAGIYFFILCYMIWKVFKNIRHKRKILPSMSPAHRLHCEGIIYRFNFLMLATIICAAITIISFILSQIAEAWNKWDENMELEVSSAPFIGVYGMWNIYICAILILYAPSHKKWPTEL